MSFNFKPNLTGYLLTLRPLAQEDFDELYAVANDPLIWELHPEKDRYKKEVFAQFFLAALESDTALIATDLNSGDVIGSSRYHGYDDKKSEIEIGWSFLARSCWGGAYNGEMKRLLLNHAFQFVESVNFVIGVENLRSQKAAEKIGGVLVDTNINSGGLENVIYKISRANFLR